MNRGDRREPIFKDDADRERFIQALGEACAKTNWQVHALCLIPNHFHLVLRRSHYGKLLSVGTDPFIRDESS